MKKTLYLLLIVFTACSNIHASNNIPDYILKAHATKYPQTEYAKWKISHDPTYPDSTYEVLFKIADKECSAQYDKSGNPIQTREELDPKILPDQVLKKINAICPEFKLENATRVCIKDPTRQYQPFLKDKSEYYDIFLLKGKDSYKLYFSYAGELLNTPEMKTIE